MQKFLITFIMNYVKSFYFNEIFFFSFYQTILQMAVDKGNIDIVKLLLAREDLNVNVFYVLM